MARGGVARGDEGASWSREPGDGNVKRRPRIGKWSAEGGSSLIICGIDSDEGLALLARVFGVTGVLSGGAGVAAVQTTCRMRSS